MNVSFSRLVSHPPHLWRIGWVTLCCGGHVLCIVGSGTVIPGLSPLDNGSTLAQLWQPKMPSDIAKCLNVSWKLWVKTKIYLSGDNFPRVYIVSTCLLHWLLWSEWYPQGCLCDKPPWRVEMISPSGAGSSHAFVYWPLLKIYVP